MKAQSKPAFPFVAGLTLGALAVAAIMGARAPATWEECFIDRMEDSRIDLAGSLLARYCQAKYPASIQQKN